MMLPLAAANADFDTGVVAEQLEWQHDGGERALKWDVTAWAGNALDRVVLQDEGRDVSGNEVENRVELHWAHALGDWIPALADFGYLLVGARHDDGATPSRTYFALGFRSLEPGRFRYEGVGYVGDYGHLGVRASADFDVVTAGRWALTARGEGEVWNDDHDRWTVGSGPIMAGAGIRLRYEVTRGIAPYAGYEYEWLFDDTADQAEARGGEDGSGRWMLGLRLAF